ncbi:TPS1 [Symbiodinium natans]|uniref:TPS1 protein n=1 Tax=Symbiodinium natans TaxID=878477 RepID=A0A812SZX8_9DINO|nr:TPS1 [Symbiodinium natans]
MLKEGTYEECCGLAFQEFMLVFLGKAIRDLEDVEELREIQTVMKTYLLFVNSLDTLAWELAAQAEGKMAIAHYNTLTEPAANEGLSLEGFMKKRLAVMKDLNHAAHFCENYFQVLWYHRAQAIGRSAVETDINSVRPQFENVMQLYKVIQDASQRLLYDKVADSSVLPEVWPAIDISPEIVLVVNVVGKWASVGVVTFWSILKHRTTPLRVFVLGDQEGIRDWRQVVKDMRLAVPQFMHRVRFHYIDIFLHPRMINYFSRLPPECASTNMSKALFARLICHELLPDDVARAIAIDLGDILVFEDILGLWREGDLLKFDELLAASSHRSAEETLRHTKPTTLNGGLVLYEIARMRRSGYTEDTLSAARGGLERGYGHFCMWDQDIINAMHQDLWNGRRVRVLPCRWSLFPVAGWQFFWNTPSFWLRELVQFRRYPGFLGVDHFEHFCPGPVLMLHTMFAFGSKRDRKLARDVALVQGARNEQPGSALRGADGSMCACGEKAALLHVPSTMKLWPWVQRLFSFHSPPFLPKAEEEALFTSRAEQGEEIGGGFWGAEGEEEMATMRQGTLRWAMSVGATLVSQNCATMPTNNGNYADVQFEQWKRGDSLTLVVQTNAHKDAHLFIGKITPIPNALHALGLEIVVDAFDPPRTLLRWGMGNTAGEELASHSGRVLQDGGSWSTFWVQVTSAGLVTVGSGNTTSSESSLLSVMLELKGGYDLPQMAHVYVGSLGEQSVQWLICHQ